MDIENLELAASLYREFQTLALARKKLSEMSDKNNCAEGQLCVRDEGSHIILDLSGAIDRKDFLDAIADLIRKKEAVIEDVAKDL